VLLDLVTEFKMLFHEFFVMEVNLFYEKTLNKVGGKHPSKASRVQCWALVTKLLKTIFQATHKAQSFATEAGGSDMDPLRTNGYFLYAALEELRVLKDFSKVKWRRQEEFGYNMQHAGVCVQEQHFQGGLGRTSQPDSQVQRA
jgi:hypothetical protein